MSATRRLAKEINDINKSSISSYCQITPDEQNVLIWCGTLMPSTHPYCGYCFNFSMEFPPEYPFKPPKTKIYHPNINEKGQICMPIIAAENWKPATKAEHVLQSLLALVNDPEPDQAVRSEVAEEFLNDREKFMENAISWCKSFATPK